MTIRRFFQVVWALFFVLVLAIGVVLFSLLCYTRADRNPHGRYFAEILGRVERRALEPLPRQQLYEAGVRGMRSALDEHTGYSNQAEAQQLNELLDQEFAGIGIRLDLGETDGTLTVLSPIYGSPAYKAGLRAGFFLPVGRCGIIGGTRRSQRPDAARPHP